MISISVPGFFVKNPGLFVFIVFEGLYLAGFNHLSSHSKKVRCHSTPF